MPIVQQQAKCGAPNAFRLKSAIWQLFLDQLHPRHIRSYISTPIARQTSETAQNIPTNTPFRREELAQSGHDRPPIRSHHALPTRPDKSSKPTWYYNSKRKQQALPKKLSQSLEQLRDRNRASIIRDFAYPDTRTDAEVWRPAHPDLTARGRENNNLRREQARKLYKDSSIDGSQKDGKQIQEKANVLRSNDHRLKTLRPRSITGDVMEYTGKYVLPSAKSTTEPRDYPWMKDRREDSELIWKLVSSIWKYRTRLNMCSSFTTEIQSFVKYIKPTDLEIAARDAVIRQTRDLIHDILPDHSTEVFGSQRTGLNLATSDIDIRLWKENVPEMKGTIARMAPRHQVRKILERDLNILHHTLDAHPDYKLCQLRHARYPLISVQHTASGYDLQIVCNNDTANSRETIKELLQKDEDIYALFSLWKTMLDIRGLSDVYRGGLGSYSLLIMIIAALRALSLTETESVSRKFLLTLRFYGEIFDSYKHGLTVTGRVGSFKKLPLAESIEKKTKAKAANDSVSLPIRLSWIS